MDHRHNESRRPNKINSLARGLGWFSIGLGLAEVLMPRALSRNLGMRGRENLLRAYGVREIATGIGILSSKNRSPWIWGRVAGDALDLVTLSGYLNQRTRRKRNIAVAIGSVIGITLLDVACGQSLSKQNRKWQRQQYDYSNRSGLPRSPDSMRGTASDFEVPRDMRIPEALRPRPVS